MVVNASQIDAILAAVENPIRRRIIKRLSQEPSYPLEISKELGIGQQLVAAHLAMMERHGIVSSSLRESPYGPKRRLYFLNKSACVTISFGPHLYSEHVSAFESPPKKLSEDCERLLQRISESKKNGNLADLSKLVADIDEKIAQIENEKTALLYIRNLAMQQAAEILNTQALSPVEKRVLYFLLDEKCEDIERISTELNLREGIIRETIEKLKTNYSFTCKPNLAFCH
ncbi:MAG: ArsR family transcriptional regulator [Candidatus Bathyarchaeota archaeon]|nr:ArsR family transcriptional regulator [Candidatus Bathyarchaeota archaeon]